MSPTEPNEPLPTTPVGPAEPRAAPAPPQAAQASLPAGPGPAPGWGFPPAYMPPPTPPRRDRLAVAIVAFIFGGLFLVFFGFLLLAYSAVRGETPAITGGPRVGVLEVRGPIGMDGGVDAERTMKQIRKFAEDTGLKGVVVRVDSPGGAVGPTQEIFDELRRLAGKKPVVCSLGSLAASGGFYVAMACPEVVAAPSTLTGSIGVISQFVDVSGLAAKVGVDVETVKSGKLKDVGNPFRQMTADERAYWQGVSDRIHAQFIKAVMESRKLAEEDVRRVADGRVITGEDALAAGLVDGLGNFYDAVESVKKKAKISGEPTLVYPSDERSRFLDQLLGGAARALVGAIREGAAAEAGEARAPAVYFLAR
jgi:protease-4